MLLNNVIYYMNKSCDELWYVMRVIKSIYNYVSIDFLYIKLNIYWI